MNLVEKITSSSKGIVSSLNGRIQLDEAQARLIISSNDGTPRNIQDIDGTHIYDVNGLERSRLNELGLTTIATDGAYKNRVGQKASDGTDGMIYTTRLMYDRR